MISIENLSTRKTETILAENKPEVQKPQVIERPLRGQKLEVTLILDQELIQDLEEIEMLIGKKLSKLELFKLLTKEKLENLKKPKRQAAQPAPSESQISSQTRHIPNHIQRQVKERDQHRCQFKDPLTGRRCEERHNLQFEHILPFAKGGKHTPDNLELLCSQHNRLRAVEQFGAQKMRQFYGELR